MVVNCSLKTEMRCGLCSSRYPTPCRCASARASRGRPASCSWNPAGSRCRTTRSSSGSFDKTLVSLLSSRPSTGGGTYLLAQPHVHPASTRVYLARLSPRCPCLLSSLSLVHDHDMCSPESLPSMLSPPCYACWYVHNGCLTNPQTETCSPRRR